MTGFDGWHGDWTEPHGGEPYDGSEPYDHTPLDHTDPYHEGLSAGSDHDGPDHDPDAALADAHPDAFAGTHPAEDPHGAATHAPGEHADPPTEPYAEAPHLDAHPEPYTPEHSGEDPDPAAFAPPPDAPDSPFPPHLDLDLAPADGQPWTDPDLLGAEHDGAAPEAVAPTDPPAALLSDLAAADGGEHGPAESDDPAVRALAAYWSR
jgi:hypothetical protein